MAASPLSYAVAADWSASTDAGTITLPGGAPVTLPKTPLGWQCEEGSLDVFLADKDGRLFITECEPGSTILEPAPDDTAITLIAYGKGRLAPIAATSLASWAAHSRASISAVDHWVQRLSEALSEDGTQADERTTGDTVRWLRPGERLSMADGGPLGTRPGSAWLDVEGGAVPLLFGQEQGDADAPFPLTPAAQLAAKGPLAGQAITTAALAAEDRLDAAIAQLHAAAVRALATLRDRSAANEAQRLKQGAAHDKQAIDTAMDRLSAIVEERDAIAAAPGREALYRACQLVGDSLGLQLDSAAETSMESGDTGARIGEIARRSRIQSRRVLLDDGWWRQDLGPLIGLRDEDNAPLALLPRKANGYDIIEPASGKRWRATAQNASSVAPTAYMLYRPLPEGQLTPWRLAKFALRRTRRDFIGVAFAGSLLGLIGAATPVATGFLFESVVPSGERYLLFQVAAALALGSLLSFVFTLVREQAILRLDGRTASALQPAIWDRLMRLPASFFKRYSAGEMQERATGVEQVRSTIIEVTLAAGVTAIFSLFHVALMLYYDWRLGLLAIVLVAVLAAVTAFIGVRRARESRNVAIAQGSLASLVFQLISGMAKLRVAGAEPRAFARWGDRFSDERRAILAERRWRNRQQVFNAGYQTLATAALFAAIAAAEAWTIGPGIFVAFIAAYGAFQGAALELSRATVSLIAAIPRYRRAKPIMDATPESDATKADPGTLRGHIEVNNVVFRYRDDEPPVLDGLSLAIKPGQFAAVVGPSGSGKSTLLRLLLGLEQAESGEIFYDRQALSGLDVQRVRRQIGVVLQHGRIFAGDILSNIKASSGADLETCKRAAEWAGLGDDLEQFPMGLHTGLTEGAPTLSGGQRQRLLIARALAARPRLLFLDEATSALDNKTQSIVTESLDRLAVTRLVVAHRITTIADADVIFVLDNGRVVETGSYHDLIAKGGHFAALATRQTV